MIFIRIKELESIIIYYTNSSLNMLLNIINNVINKISHIFLVNLNYYINTMLIYFLVTKVIYKRITSDVLLGGNWEDVPPPGKLSERRLLWNI